MSFVFLVVSFRKVGSDESQARCLHERHGGRDRVVDSGIDGASGPLRRNEAPETTPIAREPAGPQRHLDQRHHDAARTSRWSWRGRSSSRQPKRPRTRKPPRERNDADRRDTSNAEADLAVGYNAAWWDRGTNIVSTRRTSLIVDPRDGRVPPLTSDAQQKAAARADARRLHPADGPENLSLADRCIVRGTAGPPMLPAGYNNNYQIVQTPDHVVILVEMIHDARIISLDGRPHLAGKIRQWTGDSRGRWDDKTLVVETTNFTDKTNFRGSGDTSARGRAFHAHR